MELTLLKSTQQSMHFPFMYHDMIDICNTYYTHIIVKPSFFLSISERELSLSTTGNFLSALYVTDMDL